MHNPSPSESSSTHRRYLYEWTEFETEVLCNISSIQRQQRLNSASIAKHRQSVASQIELTNSLGDLSLGHNNEEELTILRYSDFFSAISSIKPEYGFPDLAFSTIQRSKASKNRFIGEIKSVWSSDIRNCNIRKGISNLLPLRDKLAQLFTYMYNYKLRYGFCSTYKTYIFVKREEDFRYLISVPIGARQTKPTLRDCFSYLNYLTSEKGYLYNCSVDLGTLISGLLLSMSLNNLKSDEKEDRLLEQEVSSQLERVQNILQNSELRNSLSRSRRGSLVSGVQGAPTKSSAGTIYREKSLTSILERKGSPPPITPNRRSPIPETRPLGHEIERSGLPPNLFDFNLLEPNKVFVREDTRGITHIFKIDRCPESKGQDPDRGVYFTTFTGRPAVLKFFGDGLGWTALSMWQQECEARDKLKRTNIIPVLYLSGEVILGRFGHRTCRGFAIIMERVEGQTLSTLQMSPQERDEFQVALLEAMVLVREQNMVHGEPNRSNIMWNRDQQRVVLLDWKEWWENEYGLRPNQRELEVIMKMDERVRRSSLKGT